jgi:hypothetical protein
MIEIKGLSSFQRQMCQRIWEMDTMEEILDFFHQLPRRHKPIAISMFHMIIAELLDEIDPDSYDEADTVIQHVRSKC